MFYWLWHFYPDWIKAKREQVEEQQERMTRLCSTDTSLTRARRMCEHAGLSMNINALAMLPAMAEVLDAYRDLDKQASTRR